MSASAFLDTNILVYALDRSEPRKRAIARELLASERYREFVLSTQVLSELYVTVTRKLERPLPGPQAAAAIELLCTANRTIPVDPTLVKHAIETSRSAQLSHWDALIVAAAAHAGCAVLLTEDLNDGQVIGTVRIENPFREG